MRDAARSTWTVYEEAAAPLPETIVDTSDALTDPAVEDMLPGALAAYLPKGAAWGTPDGAAPETDTVLSGVMRVFLAVFVALYVRLAILADNSRALTVRELLDAWEADYGLPDPCVEQLSDEVSRRSQLLDRVRSTGVIRPQDFVQLAHANGYLVAIEERHGFRCGSSRLGGAHFLGSSRQEAWWRVHVFNLEKQYFRCGASRCGERPLFEALNAETLLCLFERYAPGWTKPRYTWRDDAYPAAI